MTVGGANGRNDAFSHAGDDRLLAGATHQPVDVRPHGNAGRGFELDAVFGYGGDQRRVDDLRIDADAHRLQHVATG